MDRRVLQNLHKNREEIIDFCNNHKHIFLYGVGNVAHDFYVYLSEEGIVFDAFIVSPGHKTCDRYLSKPVYDNTQINMEDAGIILSVPERYHQEITEHLSKCGVDVGQNVYCQKILYSLDVNEITAEDAYYGVEKTGRYFVDFDELDKIGIEQGTDKNSQRHDYLRKYEMFLRPCKNRVVTIVEMGVFSGKSLSMWERFFPLGRIIGIDIDKMCKQYETSRITVDIRDLSLIENLDCIGKEYSPDIIVDDASHIWSHQIKAFLILINYLQHGGIYIMEDIGTSFGKYKKSLYSDATVSGYEFMSALADIVTGGEIQSENKVIARFENELKKIAPMIDMICFVYGSVIVIKK